MSAAVEGTSQWVYRGLWGALSRWFLVPEAPPTPPPAPDGRVDAFKPGEGFLRYLKLAFWIVAVLVDVGLLALWIATVVTMPWLGLLLLPVFLIVGIVPAVIAYIALHLRYDTTWYVMTDRAVRIRRGVWSIRETTITFENVQNVKVSQGPLQRYFGIADVVVETAGSGAAAGGGQGGAVAGANQGRVEGIADAHAVRDRILARLRESRFAGLGDEDDEGDARWTCPGWTAAHLAVLREIHDAVTEIPAAP